MTDKLNKEEYARVFAMYFNPKRKIFLNPETGISYYGTLYQLNSIKEFLHEYKLLLKPLSAISDEDAIEVAKSFYALCFKGSCPTGWVVKRNELYPNESLFINHKDNDFSFNIDLVDGNLTLYRMDEYDPCGNNVNAVDKFRELGYALPYKNKSLFKLGIAIEQK